MLCKLISFIYQSWWISCERKSFPDQKGKNGDWNRGDPVLFLQQCPHSLQIQPATPTASFSQYQQLVEGGLCAKGEERGSEWRAKKMPVLALFWCDQIPPSHVHCFLLQTCRLSEDRIRREEAVWLVLFYERMNSVRECSLESFKNLKHILVRYTLIKYFKHLWDLKVILRELGGLFSKRKINIAYPVYK